MSDRDFFVGYLPASYRLRRLALAATVLLCGAFAALALVVGRTPAAIGPSDYGEDIVATGVFVARPYPLLVTAPDAAHPKGRTLLLGGEGKRGAQDFGRDLDSRTARLEGIIVKRGEIDMALVGGADQLKPVDSAHAAPRGERLGRWRVTGEICDGKCVAGGMRPGAGIAHKACANLCISGGLPPVLVTAAPIEGRSYLLLAGKDGGPAPDTVADLTAIPLTLEGDLVRLGDMLILSADWSTARKF